MFFLRRMIGRFLFVAVLGWVIRKLRSSENPNAQKVAHTANKVLGGAFGVDATGQTVRPRRMRRSAGSAAVGGILSYFLDPKQGRERRDRVKTFASEQIRRAKQTPALPPAQFASGPVGSTTYSGSSIT